MSVAAPTARNHRPNRVELGRSANIQKRPTKQPQASGTFIALSLMFFVCVLTCLRLPLREPRQSEFVHGQSSPQMARTATQHTSYKLFQVSRRPAGKQRQIDDARDFSKQLSREVRSSIAYALSRRHSPDSGSAFMRTWVDGRHEPTLNPIKTYNSNIRPIPTHFSPSGVQGVGT